MQNNVIKRLRIAVEQTTKGNLKQFAHKCNIPYRTLQSYISGEREPGASNLIKIATQLCISIDWLLTGEGEMMKEASTLSDPLTKEISRLLSGMDDDFKKKILKDIAGEKYLQDFEQKMGDSKEELKSSSFKPLPEKKKTA